MSIVDALHFSLADRVNIQYYWHISYNVTRYNVRFNVVAALYIVTNEKTPRFHGV